MLDTFVSVDALHIAEILAVHAYAWLWRAGLIHTEVSK